MRVIIINYGKKKETYELIAKFNDMSRLIEAKEDRLKFRNWIKDGASTTFSDLPKDRLDTFADRVTDTFIEFKPRLKSPYNDFYHWMKNSTFEDFYNYLRELQAKVGQDKLTKEKEKDGARLVYSDDNWKVYEITTYEASVKYGKGTKWCISGSKRWTNGEEGAGYFDQYYSQDGVRFYFFINKDGNKYALAVYPEGSCEIFNAEDVAIPFIPNAPVIDEIKAEYKNESDSNILVNAIMNKKLPEDILEKIIQETFEDNTGFECEIFSKDQVDELISEVDNMIPDGYLETTDSDDYWDGDLPYFAFGELEALSGHTKEEKIESLKRTLKDEADYIVLEDSYDGWEIDPIKDYTQLFLWAMNRCGISDWSEGELDDFFINSLDSDALEHTHPGRMYVFPIMLANRLIWDIKNGDISGSVLNGIGLSDNYLKNFRESFDKIYFENEKVSDSVLNEAKNENYYYHGSSDENLKELNRPINWLTKDYEYAKFFALATNDSGYVYKCNPTIGNLFDVGKTDSRVFDLLPIKPYRFSREFEAIVRKLNLSEDKARRLVDNVIQEYDLDNNGYRMKIDLVTRSVAFKRILESLGYDGIHAIEYNEKANTKHETFGLFDKVQVLDCDEVKALSKDESITEEKAITWGDLDYGKKTDTRSMMGGRGTGHFGTGFYFVGAEGSYGIKDGKIPHDYEPSRPIYEIDLDAYNLYKPKDNESAYRIHDAMGSINNYYSPDMNRFLFSNIDADTLEDNFYSAISDKIIYDEDLDDEDFSVFEDDIDFDDSFIDDEDEEESEPRKGLDEYLKAVKKWVEDNELIDWINTGYDDFDTWLNKNSNKLGIIESEVAKAIQNRDKYIGYVEYAIDVLCKAFNTDRNTLIAMCKAFYNMKSEDSISTLLFKEFGYEGVDVTHLNHDAQGLSGLDNFGYGTVIYDLKPGTFKKIVEPRDNDSGHYKNGNSKTVSVEDLNEYLDTIESSSEVYSDYPIMLTDEPYKLKNILEESDVPYRIFKLNDVYYFQNALGNKTHWDMMNYAIQKGYADGDAFDIYNDEAFMVFIPSGFDGDMRYFTSLGEDSYYCVAVYPYGRIYVRDSYALKNSLFNALGKPERVVYYDYDGDICTIVKDNKEVDISVEYDLDGNPDYAINFDIDSIPNLDDIARPVVEDYEPTEEDFPYDLDDICREYPNLISNNYESCGNAFIMPDGRFILSGNKFDTHDDFAFDTLLKLGDFESEEEIEDTWDTDEILRAFTKYFDLVRVNDGSNKSVENRAYFVIPKNTLTSGQQNALLSYLDVVLGNKFRNKTYDIQAYAGKGLAHHSWDISDGDVTSDMILDDTKFALSRGFFGESLEEDASYGTCNYFVRDNFKQGDTIISIFNVDEDGDNYLEHTFLKRGNKFIDERGAFTSFDSIMKDYQYDATSEIVKSKSVDEFINSCRELVEKIVKKGSKWQVQSEKGRNLGTYDTKEDAEDRLKQIHYFKSLDEELSFDDDAINSFRYIELDNKKYSKEQVIDFINQYNELLRNNAQKIKEFNDNDIVWNIQLKSDYKNSKDFIIDETNDFVFWSNNEEEFIDREDSDEEIFERDLYDHLIDYLTMGMSSGTYFGMEDFSKEELQYIQKNANKTKRPLYRLENSFRASKIGDVIDMYPMRSFTATKAGVNYIARTFDFDDEHNNTLYKTQGNTLYYDIRGITQDSEDFASEDEVFVWGRFKVIDISEINLNKRVFKLVTIEQIDTNLKEHYFKHVNEDSANKFKIVCFVNNYQYGENRFKKMREQFSYKEELLDDKHHLVFMEVDSSGFNFLKNILNSNMHDNVNKVKPYSELYWIYAYKKRLEKKESLKEDLTKEVSNLISRLKDYNIEVDNIKELHNDYNLTLRDLDTNKTRKIKVVKSIKATKEYCKMLKDYFKHINEDLQETDSEGNVLSQEQIKFFKNSKIRDNQGRLLVCYHGTNKDFDTFDKSKWSTGEGDVWGKGFYFFKGNKDDASKYGSKIKEVYLNIINPIKEEYDMFEKLIKSYLGQDDIGNFEVYRKRYWNDLNDEDIIVKYLKDKFKKNVSFEELVIHAGYDGRIVGNEIICYEPNQIKSITNKTPTSSNNINEDYKDDFINRTNQHIARVNKYAKKINKSYPNHDSDKFNELFDGYSLMNKKDVSEEEQKMIDDATYKHVLNNEHHCEHWCNPKDIEGFSRNNPTPHGCLDCSKMPEYALEEPEEFKEESGLSVEDLEDMLRTQKSDYDVCQVVFDRIEPEWLSKEDVDESLKKLSGRGGDIFVSSSIYEVKNKVSDGNNWRLVGTKVDDDEIWLMSLSYDYSHGDILDIALNKGYISPSSYYDSIFLRIFPSNLDASQGLDSYVDYKKVKQYEYDDVKVVDLLQFNYDFMFEDTKLYKAFGKPIDVKIINVE